jgi:hypothetical protein
VDDERWVIKDQKIGALGAIEWDKRRCAAVNKRERSRVEEEKVAYSRES